MSRRTPTDFRVEQSGQDMSAGILHVPLDTEVARSKPIDRYIDYFGGGGPRIASASIWIPAANRCSTRAARGERRASSPPHEGAARHDRRCHAVGPPLQVRPAIGAAARHS